MTNTSAATAAAATTLPAATSGPFVRPSRCTTVQGTSHCTCEPGYTISGRDSYTCTGTPKTFHLISTNYNYYNVSPWDVHCACFNSISDIDECELFHNGQAGRLCLHACINTPGGYRCSCPAGYNLTRDGRSCKGALNISFFGLFSETLLILTWLILCPYTWHVTFCCSIKNIFLQFWTHWEFLYSYKVTVINQWWLLTHQ